MPWKGYSMYFITRKTHPLDSKLRQENSSSEPSDRWCPCVPGTFEPVVTRSAAAPWSGTLFRKRGRNSSSTSFSQNWPIYQRILLSILPEINQKLIHDFSTIGNQHQLAVSKPIWMEASLFRPQADSGGSTSKWRLVHKLFVPVRNRLIQARTCWGNAASTFNWCAAHGDMGNDLLEMSFGRVVTLALSGSLEHLKITGCSVVRRLVLAW